MIKSQRQIRSNYQSINRVFAENHQPFNDEFRGMHSGFTFREQAGDPITAVDQIALYTKAVAGATSLFFRPSNNQTPIRLNYPSLSTGIITYDPDVYIDNQYSYVAGPFIIYMGKLVGKVPGDIIVLTPTSTLIYVGLVFETQALPGNIVNSALVANPIGVISGGNFTVEYWTTTLIPAIYYLAIGIP